MDDSKKSVQKESLLQFLEHGVKYVFPQRPGPVVRGIPTAHSAPPLSEMVQSGDRVYVWPDIDGEARGESIVPLYPTVPKAARADKRFYELVALVDAIRIGKAREVKLAVAELRKRVLQQ
ncbi:hypothetical protein EHM92_02220 [bacterium]|nr:MAG: hypothetical protein EHM92_02220 [bacterium]